MFNFILNRSVILGLIISTHVAHSQTAEYVFKNSADSSFNCYLTIIRDQSEIKGLIVRDYSSLPKVNSGISYPFKWKDLALENGLAILYTVTSNFVPELCYNDSSLVLLDALIHEVVEKYSIPKHNIFIGGISASGTRALKYAQFCDKGQSQFGITIKGVFAVDSPLDLERFYNSAYTHKANFTDGMLWEANLMTDVFPKKLGGTPETNLEAYRNSSVYSHTVADGCNAEHLLNTPTILFHEPDIDWWIKERGATYYDINSFDIAGMYNYLKQHDHQDIELITTTGKGFDREGNRNCHSWTIVDEKYLIDWILERTTVATD